MMRRMTVRWAPASFACGESQQRLGFVLLVQNGVQGQSSMRAHALHVASRDAGQLLFINDVD